MKLGIDSRDLLTALVRKPFQVASLSECYRVPAPMKSKTATS